MKRKSKPKKLWKIGHGYFSDGAYGVRLILGNPIAKKYLSIFKKREVELFARLKESHEKKK